ncbi:MAG: DEAD/DEAH box helicase family protein [bacterium]|nr:DEAD/DEAH box helicase family protein [bacterium]
MKYFKHQESGEEYLITRNGGYLFWKPRVGKTFPALGAILKSKKSPILIITKPSIMETFRKALVNEMGMNEEDVGVCETNWPKLKRQMVSKDKNVVICNYQAVVPLRIMDAQSWKTILFDESHAISNISAKVTRYIQRHIKAQAKDQMRLALTGTPASESPLQYASQFFIVDGHFMGYENIHDYLHTEWTPSRHGNKMVPNRIEHLNEIKEYIHEHASFLSMEDVGMGSKLLYNQRYVHANDEQLELLDWARDRKDDLNSRAWTIDPGTTGVGDMVYAVYENMIASGINPRTGEIVSTAKLEDVLSCYLDNPEPMLILSTYVAIFPIAVKMFRLAGIACDYIDGTVGKREAEEIRYRFQEGELSVVFGQSAVVSEGLDFSRADVTYYLNNAFSLNTREQTSMRTTNVNKKTPVEIIDICTVETFEDKIVKRLNKKEAISNSFLRLNSSLI